MFQLGRRLFQRAIRFEPVTWLILVAVFGGFMWLNFNVTRKAYVARYQGTWHGGIREGFPLPWWDSGSEAECSVAGEGMKLEFRAYGGWQPLGVSVGVLVFIMALTGSAYVSEKLLQRRRLARTGSPVAPVNRPVRIRLATGLVTLLLLGGTVALNLVVTTSVNGPGTAGVPPFTQSMGWPFTTYTASEPVLVNADRAAGTPLTTQEANAFLETHAPLFWKRAHWSGAGIVLNTVSALLLIAAAACSCEWLGRRNLETALGSSSRQAAIQAQYVNVECRIVVR